MTGSAAPARLVRFALDPAGTSARLRLETDRGETFDCVVTRDQLDRLADAIDDVLLTDETDEEAGGE